MKLHFSFFIFLFFFICIPIYTIFSKDNQTKVILNPIVVSATKNKKYKNDLTIPVNVLSENKIENIQPDSLDDLIKLFPSVESTGGPRTTSEKPIIRGLTGRRVLILIDGARQNFNSGHKGRIFLDIDNFKKVELIRGPASALYGSDAIAGVVALTTKDGIDYLKSGQRYGISTKIGYQTVNGEKSFNGMIYGLIHDNFDYLISSTFKNSVNIKLGNNKDLLYSGSNSRSGLFKLVWYPDHNNIIKFKYDTLNINQKTPLISDMDDPSGVSLVNKSIKKETFASDISYNFNLEENIKFNFYKEITNIDEVRNIDHRSDNIQFTTTGSEIKLSNMLVFNSSNLLFTLGIESTLDEMKSTRNNNLLLLFPDAKTMGLGIYIQNELSFKDINIIPGIRYDRFISKSHLNKNENINENYSPKFHIDYKIFDNDKLFYSYSQGFRSPSIQELYISGIHYSGSPQGIFVPNPLLKPERSTNNEIGFVLRSSFEESYYYQDMYVNLYHNDLFNFIDTDVYKIAYLQTNSNTTCNNPGDCVFYKNINIKKGYIRGFEFQYQYLYKLLSLNLNYNSLIGVDLENNDHLSNIPADKLTSNISLRFLDDEYNVSFRNIYYFQQNRIPKNSSRENTQESSVYDIYSNWNPSKFKKKVILRFAINNLTNLYYRKHLSSISEPGRNFKIELKYVF